MELWLKTTFARGAKLTTSGASWGHRTFSVRTAAGKNDKGALRMKVGLRVVRGALVGALIAIALPVAAYFGTLAVTSSAYAQASSNIVVEGNRRVEADTVRSYF